MSARRIHIEIDGRDYVLGGGLDLVDVMASIEAAAASPPAFVDLVAGDERVAVLIHSHSRVVVTVHPEAVPHTVAEQQPWVPVDEWEL